MGASFAFLGMLPKIPGGAGKVEWPEPELMAMEMAMVMVMVMAMAMAMDIPGGVLLLRLSSNGFFSVFLLL